MTTKKNKRRRSARNLTALDDFLADEGKREEFEAVAVKEVLAWQIEQAMKAGKLSRSALRPACGPAAARSSASSTLARISHTERSIGAPNQRK